MYSIFTFSIDSNRPLFSNHKRTGKVLNWAMISIPETFSATVIRMHGERARIWLDSLPERIAWCEERWKLKVLPPFDLSYNYVAPVVLKDGADAVLKICLSGEACRDEIRVLEFYGGDPMCSLIDADPAGGILLQNRLKPGNKLMSVRDERKSIAIAASLIRAMKNGRAHPLDAFTSVSDLAFGITKFRRYYRGGTGPLPERIVQKVESLFPALISGQKNTYLLHGDLHHGNILQSDLGWKLIDPKGVVGEIEYELIPFLMNRLPGRNTGDLIDKRILLFCQELDIDIERTYAWGLCHSLLSAWWNIEDNLDVSDQHLAIIQYFSERVG